MRVACLSLFGLLRAPPPLRSSKCEHYRPSSWTLGCLWRAGRYAWTNPGTRSPVGTITGV
eukprot:365643-Chlamydomonas_euryale.AAC.23